MIGVQNGVQNGTLHRNGTRNGQTGAITGSTAKGANHLKLPRPPKVQRVKVPKEVGFGPTIHYGPTITTQLNGIIDTVLKAQRVKAQRVKPPKVVVGEVIGMIIMVMGNVYVVHVPPPPPLTKNVPSRVMDIPSHTYSTYP